MILNAAVILFETEGEEKTATLLNLFEETEMECDLRET